MLHYDLHRSRSRSDTVSQLLAQLAETSTGPSPGTGAVVGIGPSLDAGAVAVVEGVGGSGGSWADRPMGLLRGVGVGVAVAGVTGAGGVSPTPAPASNQAQDQDQEQGKTQDKGEEGTAAVDSTATGGGHVSGIGIPPPVASSSTPSSSSASFDKVLPPKTLRRSARALYRYLSSALSAKVTKSTSQLTYYLTN